MILKEVLPQVLTLPNGLRFIYQESQSVVSHIGVMANAGSRYERAGEEGLAHFLEHCIFKGTKTRKSLQILSRLDSVGGELNAYTNKEEICVFASFTQEHFNRAIDLLADIVLNPSFPEKEIAKEREVVLDEINSYLDSPSDRIFDDFEEQLFTNHPLGNNILGTPDSLNSFTEKTLRSYHERFFVPKNMVVSYVGAISYDRVLKSVNRFFKYLDSNQELIEPSTFENFIPKRILKKESNYQAHGVLGGLTVGYLHEQRRATALLINILGGSALNSRLNLSIREKYGYAYTIEANFSPFTESGYWYVYFGCDPKHIKKCLKLIEKELQLLAEKPLSESQLKQAKIQIKGQISLSLESNVGQMQGLAKSILTFNDIDSLETSFAAIDTITSQELLAVAKEIFDANQRCELIYDVIDNLECE